jgi:hypothetical protein
LLPFKVLKKQNSEVNLCDCCGILHVGDFLSRLLALLLPLCFRTDKTFVAAATEQSFLWASVEPRSEATHRTPLGKRPIETEINPLLCQRAIPYLKWHNSFSTTKKGND